MHHVVVLIAERQGGTCTNQSLSLLLSVMCLLSKVWDANKRDLRLVQEVREHSKAVTCLYIPPSRDKLYSGSLDKTIRVWIVKPEGIHCIQVHDVKESVHGLTADANFAYFFSQGAGVKVFGWSGVTKHINFKQSVKCIDMIGDKLYCGCSGFSILETDLQKTSTTTFYSGTRKLLGKQSINSICIHDDLLYTGGTSVDGTAGKVLKSRAANEQTFSEPFMNRSAGSSFVFSPLLNELTRTKFRLFS
ncbi:putative transcription factor WD40-like family [Helianthus anomalus]